MRRYPALLAISLLLSMTAASAAMADSFLGDGVVASEVSPTQDALYATAVGSDGIYLAGMDGSPGAGQWRLEKRSLEDGELVAKFGRSGVVTIDPSPGWDRITALVLDGRQLFLVGESDTTLRIEKRSASRGRLRKSFGVGGVLQFPRETVVWNSSNAATVLRKHLYVPTGSGRILRIRTDTGETIASVRPAAAPGAPELVTALAGDGPAIFVAAGTAYGFRFEKRGIHQGRLLWRVDEPFTLVGCGPEAPQALVATRDSLLVGGMREGLWHLERRRKRDGALLWSVDDAGNGNCDIVYDLVIAGTSLFAVGVHNSRRRIEKRRLDDGSLVAEFGNGGVIDSPRRVLEAFSAVDACGDLVASGVATNGGTNEEWYSTRIDPITGAPVTVRRPACAGRAPR